MTPTIAFNVLHASWPEGNTLWHRKSPDNTRLIIWLENPLRQRNLWVINLEAHAAELFYQESLGHHFSAAFANNSELVITHAGMGYKINKRYLLEDGRWISPLGGN